MAEILVAASTEMAEAAAWYDSRVAGLGERFLLEAEAAFARIDEKPLTGPPWRHRRLPEGVRRMFVRSFPVESRPPVNGHGFLRGYAERTSEVVTRGRRVFCSNRGHRRGCGRTFPVLLSTVLRGFVVRTLTFFCFATAVLSGLTRRAAWLREARGALSLSSGYRLWRRLNEAQSTLRARLCRRVPPPDSPAREPLAQLVLHLRLVVGDGEADPFAALQEVGQHGLLAR